MMYLLDESGLLELLDLLADDPALLLVEAVQVLLDRSRTGTDLQGVLGDIPRYARHVRGTPRKHVSVCTEKVDEHCFLCAVEGGADDQRLLPRGAWIERDLLGVFSGLKVADLSLGCWSRG